MPDYRAALGRGGDTEMAHMTPGEAVIPRGSMTPKLWAAYQEALDRQGMAPEQYVVGSGQESINPMTGQPEFRSWGGGDMISGGGGVDRLGNNADQRDRLSSTEPRESRGGDSLSLPTQVLSPSQVDAYTEYQTTSEAARRYPDRPAEDWVQQGGQWGAMEENSYEPFTKLLPGPLQALIGWADPDMTYSAFEPAVPTPSNYQTRRTSLGRESGNQQGATQQRTIAEQSFMRPAEIPSPSFLGLSNAMSPLQRRTAIASRAVAGQGGQYTSPEANSYYDNLLQRELIGDDNSLFGMDSLLPIDLQYLSQIRGIENPADTRALLAAMQ